MKAVVVKGTGGIEAITVEEVPKPEPQGDQVLVRVRTSGINRADLMQARGHYPAPPGAPSDRLGLEFAGEVEALGPNVIGPLKVGDRVFGIVSGGGLAEYVTVHERLALPIPVNLDFIQAAAVPEVFLTAFDALDQQANLKAGEAVLIHAVGGGVGSAAVQLAHAMGCYTFGTSRTLEKLQRALKCGLNLGIDTSEEDFAAVIQKKTQGTGVPVIIDHIGAPMLSKNLEALSNRGRLVLVGLLGGLKAELNLAALLQKRLTMVGTTLRARPLEEKIAVSQRFAARVVPWLERGLVRPIVDSVHPLDEIRAAQERLESNECFGKIIMTM